MQKVLLDIYGIAPGHSQGSYSLILSEADGTRKIPVIVGQYEAQAIAIELEKINTGRPMTHDLFVIFARTYDVKVKEVIIHKLNEGVFYSVLVCEQNGSIKEIDSRTSDAIALAVRFECPIYTTEAIISEVGVDFEEDDIDKPGRPADSHQVQKPKSYADDLKNLTISELEHQLEEAVNKEDYLKAAQIRDEIDRREA